MFKRDLGASLVRAVPESPGIGVELDEAVGKDHLRIPGCFEPAPQCEKLIPYACRLAVPSRSWTSSEGR